MSEFSDGGVNQLERRARLLLRAYPPGYRADRGEEIVGTLLEATPPGRSRPSAREAASVITAGLRARRDANLRQGLAASLRQSAIVGIAVFLAPIPADLVVLASHWSPPEYVASPSVSLVDYVLSNVLVLVILAAVWHGRRWLVAVLPAVAATAAIVYNHVSHSMLAGNLLVLVAPPAVLGLVLLVPLTTRAHRLPKSLLWLLCLPEVAGFFYRSANAAHLPAGRLLFLILPLHLPLYFFSPYTTYPSLITVAVAVCWLVTDVRPLAGLTLAFLLDKVLLAYDYNGFHPALWVGFAIAIAVPVALACALVWLLHRRTGTSPPAAAGSP